ncbi:MAG: GMC oxidoreductase, partial [Gammaproteobacteria bacterium]|nr:GMC oxidoreductase [Gammaproteobacteria bacterium]
MHLVNAFEKLNWHWWPSDNYINSQPYGEGRDACNFCGHVNMGCFKRAKASTDLNYWPAALRNSAEIQTGARVRRVTTDSSGRATGADYVDSKGTERHQPARSVVMAANGIGTPRLLLLSKSDSHPNGLSNSSGLVGKNLMFHPYAMISGVFAENMKTWQGPVSNYAMSQEFYETDKNRGFVRGYTYQFARSMGPAWIAKGGLTEPVRWGVGHHEELNKRLGSMLTLAVIGEDLPELHNTVDLDPELTDSDGIPAPRISYTLSKNSRDQLDHAIQNARKVFETSGAIDILVDPLMRLAGWHLMGTARMGNDPTDSVVNKWGQSHDVDNLFV